MEKLNWINSWKSNNKKSKFELVFRVWKLTLFQLECDKEKLRFMVMNFGWEYER
tara:strand:- start:147 stop:308 length:162 start_codon:yes stop_codon:yes gene_type:complete